MSYNRTLASVETYFDKTATRTWERLTSDAPVSKIRQTVRQGRDEMRALMLSRLPENLDGARVLDAGCGAGQMTAELATRGAEVVAIDISPSLIEIASSRLPRKLTQRVTFRTGDMLSANLGTFDHVIAMDSLIYYAEADLAAALDQLAGRACANDVFTVAPRPPLQMAMWRMGQWFPRSDRSPIMVPHTETGIAEALRTRKSRAHLRPLDRITSGFYISQAMEVSA